MKASQSVIQQSPEPVRVLHVTDPHLFADAEGSLRGTVTCLALQSVLDHIRRCDWPADLVAVTGDLIQDDSSEAYDRFCAQLSPLGLPVYCVPGNHDIRALMQNALTNPQFHYCASVTFGDWLIAGIDSCVHDQAGGFVHEEELQRMETVLLETQARHALVCLHHPPLPVGSKWLDQVGLANGDEVLARMAATGKVRGAIFGHVHQAFDAMIGDVRIVGTPSTCRQFAVGSEDFALDDNPPAYRRIELRADGRLDCELIWVGPE